VLNGFINIIAALAAFTHHDSKPSLKLNALDIKLIHDISYPEFALAVKLTHRKA
jgi:hypothetical protein